MINLDSNLLLSYYQARNGASAALAQSSGTNNAASASKAPTPPWSSLSKSPKPDEMIKGVLAGRKFIDEYASQLDVKGASDDYRKLFAMHQGLATLQELATRASDKDIAPAELKRIQAAFTRGMAEVSGYIDDTDFDKLRLTPGDATDKAKMTVGVPKTTPRYMTGVVHSGLADEAVAAFQGDVKFSMNLKLTNKVEETVNFDLGEMGAQPRTMANVVKYMNQKIADTNPNLRTKFAVEKVAGEDKTTVVNGRTVKVGREPDTFALKIQGDTTETITFSAPVTEPAVYITQTSGDPKPPAKPTVYKPKTDATKEDAAAAAAAAKPEEKLQIEELLKFETGNTSDAVKRPGDKNWVDGRVFGITLPDGVEKVHTTVTGPDGALYMLADVNDAIDGQTIKGAGDVALMKFDSAGKLVYTRTLGASQDATGLGLTVGPNGQIAIAGSVTGGFATGGVPIGTAGIETIPKVNKADNGADPTKPDSFVAVFNAAGEEMWSQRQGARDDDEATGVAFGADGSLYVLGRTKGAMNGQTSNGNWDGYLRTFDPQGKLKATTQFGTSGDDKMAGLVVEGNNVVVASVEGGEVKLRNFDVSNISSPTLSATRNLGSIGGGVLAGIGKDANGNIILGGSTGATLSIGNTTRPSGGSVDAFGARVSMNFSDTSKDAIAYYGGTGDERATAMTVAGGKVYLTGTTKTDLPGMTDPKGKVDGFAVGLDLDTGAVTWSQRFTGKDQMTTPSSISVDVNGASALDRLGLPTGKVAFSDSQLITSATSARAGDTFQIRRRIGGSAVTITIEANDTLDTLAKKILRATAYSVKAEVVSDGDNKKLQLRTLNSRSSFEVLGGTGGRDVLESLGLHEGFVRQNIEEDGKMVPGDGGAPMYGLKMPRDLNLSTPEAIKQAVDKLTMATSVLRTAYRDLQAGMQPKTDVKKPTGPVPAYLTAQIANYQAGLNRLLSGG